MAWAEEEEAAVEAVVGAVQAGAAQAATVLEADRVRAAGAAAHVGVLAVAGWEAAGADTALPMCIMAAITGMYGCMVRARG
jgi:hypothetical protein